MSYNYGYGGEEREEDWDDGDRAYEEYMERRYEEYIENLHTDIIIWQTALDDVGFEFYESHFHTPLGDSLIIDNDIEVYHKKLADLMDNWHPGGKK